MAVTLSDIARHTGNSISSVSAALKGNRSTAKVSEKKRKQILQAAENLGYRPSYTAQMLKSGKTMVLGLVIGEIHTPYYGEISSALMEEAEKYGYSVQIYVSNWEHQRAVKAVDMLLAGRCDGILFFESSIFHDKTRQYEYIINNKIPMVVMSNPIPGLAYVGGSLDSGFVEAAEYLRSKKINNVTFIGDNVADLERPKLKSMIKVFDEYMINLELVECHIKPERVYEFGRNFKLMKNAAEALLIENDTLAMILIKGLNDAGINVPGQIGVIGYNDTKLSGYSIPALTTIGFDKQEFVKKSVETLVDMIRGKKFHADSVTFPTHLIKRDSA